jgi:hypothetical protein
LLFFYDDFFLNKAIKSMLQQYVTQSFFLYMLNNQNTRTDKI